MSRWNSVAFCSHSEREIQAHVKLRWRKLSRCIKGIRVELIWPLLIIVQEISFDRRLYFSWGTKQSMKLHETFFNLHQSRNTHITVCDGGGVNSEDFRLGGKSMDYEAILGINL